MRLGRLQFLYIIGKDHRRHRALGLGDAERAINQMACLFGGGTDLHKIAGHILEQREKVHLLLKVPSQRHACRLADDGNHRLAVQLGVIQPVEQMDGARSACS